MKGLDYSASALDIARKSISQATFTEWDLGNLAANTFRHERYNLILDIKVIAFIDDREKFFAAIAGKLAGAYIVETYLRHDEAPYAAVDERDIIQL